jgi:hypothetical protein
MRWLAMFFLMATMILAALGPFILGADVSDRRKEWDNIECTAGQYEELTELLQKAPHHFAPLINKAFANDSKISVLEYREIISDQTYVRQRLKMMAESLEDKQ